MPLPDDLQRKQDEIYRLRSALLVALVNIDHHLGNVISHYFGVPIEKKAQFQVGVLVKLSTREKIDTFSVITRAKESPYLKPLVGKMRELNTYRNELAHSEMAVDYFSDDPEGQWTTTRWTEHGPRKQVVDVTEMEEKVRIAQRIALTIMMITYDVANEPASKVAPTICWPIPFYPRGLADVPNDYENPD